MTIAMRVCEMENPVVLIAGMALIVSIVGILAATKTPLNARIRDILVVTIGESPKTSPDPEVKPVPEAENGSEPANGTTPRLANNKRKLGPEPDKGTSPRQASNKRRLGPKRRA